MKPIDVTLHNPWIRRVAAAVAATILAGVAALTLPVALGGSTTFTIVAGRSMEPALESGDLVITRRQASYGVGDVIVYEIPDGSPGAGVKVIHRIVAISADGGFHTAGDNRAADDVWRPTHSDILGAQWRAIPAGGVAFLWLRSPIVIGMLLSAAAFRFGIRFADAAATRRRLDGLPPIDLVGGLNSVITPIGCSWEIRRHHAHVIDCRTADNEGGNLFFDRLV